MLNRLFNPERTVLAVTIPINSTLLKFYLASIYVVQNYLIVLARLRDILNSYVLIVLSN